MVISDQWYRIDKGDGSVLVVNAVAVVRAAMGHYDNSHEVVKGGRFATPFAIYSRGDHMTAAEIETPRGIR